MSLIIAGAGEAGSHNTGGTRPVDSPVDIYARPKAARDIEPLHSAQLPGSCRTSVGLDRLSLRAPTRSPPWMPSAMPLMSGIE